MPTVHVTPESDSLLQDIADSLFKAKKVVVVTGAGISTNSGIPDFRSENGLYSLIQAQFDAASTELENKAEEPQICSSPPMSASVYERPAKRPRLSYGDDASGICEASCRAPGKQTEGKESYDKDQMVAGEVQTSPKIGASIQCADAIDDLDGAEDATHTKLALQGTRDARGSREGVVTPSDVVMEDTPLGEHAPGPPPSYEAIGVDAAESDTNYVLPTTPMASFARTTGEVQTPLASPTLLAQQLEEDVRAAHNRNIATSSESEPPTKYLSSPRTSTPRTSNLSSDIDQPTSQIISSPLSSPPPILSDPYDNSSLGQDCSRSQSPTSQVSTSPSTESEDTEGSQETSGTTTPCVTSQSSFDSSRSRTTTLPNLKGRDLFDAQIWSDPIKTSVFYTFATTLRKTAGDAHPTRSHQFLSVLRDRRKLVRCYTQNIDQLEARVGLSTKLSLGAGSRARFSARAWRASMPTPTEGGEVHVEGHQLDSSQTGPAQGSQPPGAQVLESGSCAEHEVCGGTDCQKQTLQRPSLSPKTGQGVKHCNEDGTSGESIGSPPKACCDGQQPGSCASPGPSSSVTDDKAGALEAGDNANGACADTKDHSQTVKDDSEASSCPTEPVANKTATISAPNRGVECVFLHGSLDRLRCFVCARTSSWDEADRELDTLAGRQPTCPHCAGATAAREERGKRALGVGKLRPDIVLYGEEHPQDHLIGPIVQHDLSLGPDMLLILGTSMRVHGLKVLVKEFAKAVHTKGGKVVFINFTKPPESVWADVIDFWVQSDCDAWVMDVQNRRPALWSPPGIAIDEGEQRPSRPKRSTNGGSIAVRRQSSGLSSKSNKAARDSITAKRQNPSETAKLRRQSSALSLAQDAGTSPPFTATLGTSNEASVGLQEGNAAEEAEVVVAVADNGMALSLDHIQKATNGLVVRKKMTNASREAKLNPNAKRPQSIRDDRQNGAYLTWKILEDLKRITGSIEPLSILSKPAAPVPKVVRRKKPRKSAPTILPSEARHGEMKAKPEMPGTPNHRITGLYIQAQGCYSTATWQAEAVAWSESHVQPMHPPASDFAVTSALRDSSHASISAAVKHNPRKRKRKVIDGVEVVLPGEKPRLPPPSQASPPMSAPARSHMILPYPHPSPTTATPPVSPSFMIPRALPALRDATATSPGSTKLQALEPQAQTIGPLSPVRNWQAGNPFAISDSMSFHLTYPPYWKAIPGPRGNDKKPEQKADLILPPLLQDCRPVLALWR